MNKLLFGLILIFSFGGNCQNIAKHGPNDSYFPNAVIFTENGQIIDTKANREKYLLGLHKKWGKVNQEKLSYSVGISPDLKIELFSLLFAKKKSMKSLIIWRKNGDNFLKELEFLSETTLFKTDSNGLKIARKKWVDLCNTHNVSLLVKEMYLPIAIYHNNGRTIQGTTQITEEYKYMNNPNYNLTLTPIYFEPINENQIIEIGQCSGSYKGKYLLLWKKDNTNEWKILFDTN